MPKKDFLQIPDLTADEITGLFDLADDLKAGRVADRPLAGQTLAMIFTKSSTRTRVSFEVGAFQLGAHALFLSSRDIQLGRGEPIKDTARVLSRYVDGIMIRTFAHADVEELARHATVPVINGLTDLLHPCQILADIMTVREEFGSVSDRVVAWVGDGNNVANSWLQAASVLGFEIRLAVPEGYEPDHEIFERAQQTATVSIFEDPEEAVRGAHVVNTDVWASMGQETESDARHLAFKGYCVDTDLMKLATPDAIFLHCLPAHRGEEVTDAVIDGPQSRVIDQAENRLHVQKALMVKLMGGGGADE
jgi:ornithine carbamoyltransferase